MTASNKIKSTEWQTDNDFEEYAVQAVELDRNDGERGMWVVKLEFGFELRWLRGGTPQPRVGKVVRAYGDVDGEWGPRGVVIEDKVVFFRTVKEQVEWVKQHEDEAYNEAAVLFKQREKELRERLASLPKNLQERIEAVRASSEDQARFDVYEFAVEIAKHEHAHMIALVVDSEATLDTFSRIPSQGQMGYSWNAMCVDRLEVVEKMLEGVEASEDTFLQLRQEVKFLNRYKEQRFVTQHPLEVLREIFEIAADLVRVKIQH